MSFGLVQLNLWKIAFANCLELALVWDSCML